MEALSRNLEQVQPWLQARGEELATFTSLVQDAARRGDWGGLQAAPGEVGCCGGLGGASAPAWHCSGPAAARNGHPTWHGGTPRGAAGDATAAHTCSPLTAASTTKRLPLALPAGQVR